MNCFILSDKINEIEIAIENALQITLKLNIRDIQYYYENFMEESTEDSIQIFRKM